MPRSYLGEAGLTSDGAPALSGVSAVAQEVAAVWVPLADLTPWDKNPRKNGKAIPEVAASIKRFGFGAPLVARKADGMIIAGHTRYEAAKMLGVEKVPVRFVDLDPADARLMALADNKLGEIAEWDDAGLAAVLKDLEETQGIDLADAGFASEEVTEALTHLAKESEEQDAAEAPAAPEQSDKAFTIQYNLVFDSLDDQQVWFDFLAGLKKRYPEIESVAGRVVHYLRPTLDSFIADDAE